MSKYRINVRFDLDKPTEAKAAQYLQALDKSRNAFMITAVLNEMQRQSSASGVLLEDIRQVIREELQKVSFAAAPPVFEQVQPELTEEQQAENEKVCWMTLKCSAEPKRRYVAQIAVFSAEAEPIWRRNKISPQAARMRFSVSVSRFSLCPAGCVSPYNKQGLCVPQKSPSQPESADSLGAQPPIPRKERCAWGKMFVSPSA